MDMPSYNFGHFDDDVTKESNDLASETTFGTTDNTTLATNTQSVLSNQELADISQVTGKEVCNVQMTQPFSVAKNPFTLNGCVQ